MEPFRGITNIFVCICIWLVLIVVTTGIAIFAFAAWAFLVFGGADKRRESASERVQQTLIPGESLIAEAVQLRPFALWSRRKSVGITSSRVIVISRGLLGGFTMRDIQWKDLQDAELSENVLPELCGSSLSFAFHKRDFGSTPNRQRNSGVNASGMPTLFVSGVPCDEARVIYSRAQSEEQAWEEKRRVRAIEETRAAAGGVYLNTGPNHAGEPERASKQGQTLVDELSGLKTLLDAGAISDTEFQEMKSKIIARA